MEKKIKMRAEEDKVLRISIPTPNGVVVINNPSLSFKSELVKMLIECITNGEDFDEKKIMLDLIDHCTNVEFEGDIFEVQHLTHEAKVITNEIFLIFQELIQEAYQILKLAMQQAKNDLEQKKILNEKDEILEVAEEIKKEEEIEQEKIMKEEKIEEIKIMKEEKVEQEKEVTSQKVIKKPQRSRRRK